MDPDAASLEEGGEAAREGAAGKLVAGAKVKMAEAVSEQVLSRQGRCSWMKGSCPLLHRLRAMSRWWS